MLHPSVKRVGALSSLAAIAVGAVYITKSAAQSAAGSGPHSETVANSGNASPIYGVTIPAGYRDWKLISVNRLVTDKVNQVRAQLGNDIAFNAFQEGKLPFPDGAIIAALHWNQIPSEANDKVLVGPFPGAQSFVAGPPANVQFMVKDSKKYAATGGWGLLTLRMGSLVTGHCTKPASPAMSLRKITTSCSPITRARPEARIDLGRSFAGTRYSPRNRATS